ncbi:MAG: DUF255 domain-containing protein [Bacteroidota bacterium]|nr:DUF255 domain-containing protein [Bacteroidota bacterium]
MRRNLLFLLMVITSSAYSQVAFQNISYDQMLSKAKTEGKIIFLQLESPDCRQCTEVAAKGLSDQELSSMINKTFIPVYIDANHKDRKEIEARYNTPNGFGTLFIDQNGTLLHKFSGTVSIPRKYQEQIDIALNNAGENLKVSELENEYKKGNKSIGFLELLLLKKKALNLNTDWLLDEYVSLLPADSLSSIYTLQFIAGLTPLLNSNSYMALRKDPVLFNKAWYAMPLNTRIFINARTIQKSLNKAVEDKNESFALRVAGYAKGTVSGDPTAAEKAYDMRILEFYDRINDTEKYFTKAVSYYDRYYLTINVDSAKKLDVNMRDAALSTAKRDTIKTDRGFIVKAAANYAPPSQRYTWDLKEGAWNFYKKTANPELLAKATQWIKKAIEFQETPEALDVYAHLLYKQAQITEAIEKEERSIEMKKKINFSTKTNEETLDNMKKGGFLTH